MLDDLKDTARIFVYLRFPVSILALMGGFSFGIGIFYGEVALTNRKLVLGVFLLSVAAAWYYASGLLTLRSLDGPWWKKHTIKVSWLLPAGAFGFLSWLTGKWLWSLLVAP